MSLVYLSTPERLSELMVRLITRHESLSNVPFRPSTRRRSVGKRGHEASSNQIKVSRKFSFCWAILTKPQASARPSDKVLHALWKLCKKPKRRHVGLCCTTHECTTYDAKESVSEEHNPESDVAAVRVSCPTNGSKTEVWGSQHRSKQLSTKFWRSPGWEWNTDAQKRRCDQPADWEHLCSADRRAARRLPGERLLACADVFLSESRRRKTKK